MKILRRVICYVVVLLSLTLLVLGTQIIPFQNIEKNLQKTSDYFCEREVYPLLVNGLEVSRIDHYSDTLLFNMTTYIDEKHPLQSFLKADYRKDMAEQKDSLHYVLENGKENVPANACYGRLCRHVADEMASSVCSVWQGYACRSIDTCCGENQFFAGGFLAVADVFCGS